MLRGLATLTSSTPTTDPDWSRHPRPYAGLSSARTGALGRSRGIPVGPLRGACPGGAAHPFYNRGPVPCSLAQSWPPDHRLKASSRAPFRQRVHSLTWAVEQRLRKWSRADNHAPVLNTAVGITRCGSELVLQIPLPGQ